MTIEQQNGSGFPLGDRSDLSALLSRQARPRAPDAGAVQCEVRTLAGAPFDTSLIADDVVQSIESMIGLLDDKLAKQVNLILQHPDFRQMESAWRGLAYLVENSAPDDELKIRVLSIGKNDLSEMFAKYKGVSWDQSPLFKQVYEEEYGQLGGEPYGCIVGDFEFDNRASDVEILKGMAQIAAAAHAPFISSPKPSLFQLESWNELSNPRDLTKVFQQPEYAAWRALRAADDSRYLGLALPRFLARLPYGAQTNPANGFAFEEEASGGDQERYVWANAAYAMAVNINASFRLYGWCSSIRGVESGGAVHGLPRHKFRTSDGDVDLRCATETAIGDRREAELSRHGTMPLLHRKNTDIAAFIGAHSLHQPPEYDEPAATANAELGARLPYIFATCRFAHYLKCMVRDKVGSFSARGDLERWLNEWLMNYVDGDPTNSSEATKARKPLADGSVFLSENKSSPGYYSAQFMLKPHYQLEGLSLSMRLVSELPSGKA